MKEVDLTKFKPLESSAKVNQWIDPLQKISFRKAVIARKKTVKIGNTVIALRYDEKKDRLYFRPADSSKFSPCGQLAISNVESLLYLAI